MNQTIHPIPFALLFVVQVYLSATPAAATNTSSCTQLCLKSHPIPTNASQCGLPPQPSQQQLIECGATANTLYNQCLEKCASPSDATKLQRNQSASPK